jgi:hypothetical protein
LDIERDVTEDGNFVGRSVVQKRTACQNSAATQQWVFHVVHFLNNGQKRIVRLCAYVEPCSLLFAKWLND